MRKLFILAAGLISLICLSSCNKSYKQDFYGTYTFKKVIYLSPLSSSSIDSINERMAGTKYTIKTDLFKIESAENNVEINSPNYVKEEIPDNTSPLSDVHSLIGNDIKYQYTIYNKNGNKTKWRLYVSSDNLWIASYVDNTANGTEVIMDISQISK